MQSKALLFCKKIIYFIIFLIPFSVSAQCPLMPGSVLIDANDEAKMAQWLGNNNTFRGTLLYRMSVNGTSSTTFHSLCDGKGPTLVIIKNSYTNQVFGGYNPQGWNGSLNNYLAGTGAFLFNLTYDYNLSQTTSSYQTYNNNGYGPTFGGGHDIYIQNPLNGGNCYNNPYSYQNPSSKGYTYLSGTYNFAPSEIEVYALSGGSISTSGPTELCAGGSVTLTAAGGTSYLWSTGATTSSIVANQTGNYSVTISNSGTQCPNQTLSKTVTVSPLLTLTSTQTNATAPGACNGTVTLIPNGGTQPYNQGSGINFSGTTIDNNALSYGGPGSQFNQNNELKFNSTSYDWNNYLFTKNTTPRTAGAVFQAKVKADNGTYTMIGWHDNSLNPYYYNMSHAIYFAGGNTLYIYEHGNYVGSFGGFSAGIWYDIKIELQAVGAKYYIKSNTSSSWTLLSTTNTYSDTDLRMGLSFYGYASSYPNSFFYTDDWSGGAGVNPPLTGLCAGVYNYTVTDALGCTASNQVTITAPVAVNFSSTITNVSCNGYSDGAIVINATGGNGTFLYSFDGGVTYTSNSQKTQLAAGTYTLQVKDGIGTTAAQTQVVTITQPASITPTITAGGSTTFCPGGAVTLTATAAPAASSANLVGYWKLDEGVGSNVSDQSGNNLTGTFNGSLTWANSSAFTGSQKCVAFNSGFVNVPDNAVINSLQSKMSIEAWIYQTDNSNNTIIDRANYNFLFETNPNGTPGLGFYNPNGGWSYSTSSLPVNQWVHVACTWDDATRTLKFYTNGVLTDTFVRGSSLYFNAGPINIGRQEPNGCQCNIMNGMIDEVRLWETIRTQAELQASMNAPLSFSTPVTFAWSPTTGLNTASGASVVATPSITTAYSVTATSSNGCTASSNVISVNVTDNTNPTAITKNFSKTITTSTGAYTVTVADIDNGSSDNCSIASKIIVGNATFDCSTLTGTYVVTLKVTDGSGNIATANANVNITNACNRAPVAVCSALEVNTALGACNADVIAQQLAVNSYDPDNDALSYSITPAGPYSVGNTNVTVTVTDPSGLNSSCATTLTVKDISAPIAIAKNVTIQLDATGNGSITATQIDNGSSDACGIASVSVSPNAFTCANVGNNTVTLTATDNNGNVSTQTATVTVQDNVAPVALTQNITVSLDAAGNALITATQIDNGSSDACGIASLSVSPNSFTCANVGDNTVTLTATDNNGNVSTQTATVTVQDNVAPVALTQNITVSLDASGNASITASQIDNGSADACGISSVSVSPNSFTCANVGDNTVTLTATDNNGNVSTQTATVTVQDNVAPVALTQNITVSLDASGNTTITASQIDNGSNDACGIASVSVSPNSFTCANVGDNTVTLTVTDNHGNVSTETATVTVQDNVAPVAICQNLTVDLDANGQASITVNQVDNGSTDACGIASITVDKTNFTCMNVGANTVMLTVTDINGNVSNCISTVTVEDHIAPTITCAGNIYVQAQRNNCSPIVTWNEPEIIENCTFTVNSNYHSGDQFSTGTTAVNYTVTDASGNTATCSFNVIVTPDPLVASVATKTYVGGFNISCKGKNDGQATATVLGGCLPYQYKWLTTPLQTTAVATGLTAGTYTVIITDANGSTTSVVTTLTEPTQLVAEAGNNQTVYFGYAPKACASLTGTANGGVSSYTYSWSNGGGAALTNVCPSVTTSYNFTVTDLNGCIATDIVTVCAIDVRCEKGGNAILKGQGTKVMICHRSANGKTQTLCIDASAIADHLAHGDQLGECGVSTACFTPSGREMDEPTTNSIESNENEVNVVAYPNPFNTTTTITFKTVEDVGISVKVYNINGVLVSNLFDGNLKAGDVKDIMFDGTDLPNGIYFYRLVTTSGKLVVNKFIISK